MKKAEAEVMLTKSNKKAQEKWCPFINNHCKWSCVCYNEGRLTSVKGADFINKRAEMTEEYWQTQISPEVRKSFDEGWNVVDAGCTNSLVTGEVYVDH